MVAKEPLYEGWQRGLAILARLHSASQAPRAAHQHGWSEVTLQVLPHGLEPGTHLGA